MLFPSVLLVTYMTIGISGLLSTDTSILKSAANRLISVVGTVNSFNGPKSISQAPTSSASNKRATAANARYYNYYAQAAYCPDQLKTLSCVTCQYFNSDVNADSEVSILKNNLLNTLAFVTTSDSRKEITVTFRGTTVDLRNYLLDAGFFNPGSNNIKFHEGFYTATMSLYDDVIQAVGRQLQQHPNYKLVIIGHSLGGAMARLTTFFIKRNSQFPGIAIELYTYGEPRVGNKDFADYFNSLDILSARCVNKNDIVPHIPPVSVLGTNFLYDYYVHPQLELWIQDGGIKFCDNNFYEDPKCSDSSEPLYNFADHSTYFDVIGNCSEVVTQAAPKTNPPALPTRILNFVSDTVNSVLGWFTGG